MTTTPGTTRTSHMAQDPSRDALMALRTAVRRLLARADVRCGCVAVACSGGPDSVALAHATVHVGRSMGLTVHGLVVDHALQPGSAEVAARTATLLTELGCTTAQVLPVTVDATRNVEAAARTARYAALRAARPHPDALVLLGHTMDDQAETVLLGLGRGSGPRSIAAMRDLDPPWARPLLTIRRATTHAATHALPTWTDPHNADPRFRRARLRHEAIPLLEDVLAGGVTEALARTAAQLHDDNDALDAYAATLLTTATASQGGLDTATLAEAPPAVRRRALRTWLLTAGAPELTDAHLRAVDGLVGRWRGQGGVALPGDLVARRAHGRLLLAREGIRPGANGEG